MDTTDSFDVFPSLLTPSNEEMVALLAELEASGENVARFARSRGLTSWKFYRTRRAARRKKGKPVAFDRVRVISSETPCVRVEIEHASGHIIRVPVGFDDSTLRGVLEVLRSC